MTTGNDPTARRLAELQAIGEATWGPDLFQYMTEIRATMAEQDPAVRAARLTRHVARCTDWVNWLSDQRDSAVLELREAGSSYDTIAAILGVHKSRVQQLVERLARRGRSS